MTDKEKNLGTGKEEKKQSLVEKVKAFYEEQPVRFGVTIMLCAAVALVCGVSLLLGGDPVWVGGLQRA